MKNRRMIGLYTLAWIFLLTGCKTEEKTEGHVDNSPVVIEEEADGAVYQIEECTQEDFTEEEIESTGGFWEDNTEGDPDVLGKLVLVAADGDRTVLDRLLYYPEASESVISTENRFVYVGYPQLKDMNFKGRVYVSVAKDGSDRTVTEAKDTPNITNMQYCDGYLYYGDYFHSVYRMNEDLENQYLVGETPGAFLTVADGSIYYWSNDEEAPGIYRQTLSGSETEVFVMETEAYDPGMGKVVITSQERDDDSVKITGTLTAEYEGISEAFTLEIPLS
mgnify:CR=1 FL=1